MVADLDGEFGELVLDVVQQQGASGDKGSAVFEDGFDLGYQRVIYLQRLHRTQRGLGQQCPRCGHRVDDIGLVQPPCPTLRCRSLSGDFAGIEPGSDDSDRDVGTPAGGSLHSNQLDTMGGQRVDGSNKPRSGVREGLMGEFDTVGVDDAERELMLMGIDPGDGCCHDVLLLSVPSDGYPGPAGALRHIRVE